MDVKAVKGRTLPNGYTDDGQGRSPHESGVEDFYSRTTVGFETEVFAFNYGVGDTIPGTNPPRVATLLDTNVPKGMEWYRKSKTALTVFQFSWAVWTPTPAPESIYKLLNESVWQVVLDDRPYYECLLAANAIGVCEYGARAYPVEIRGGLYLERIRKPENFYMKLAAPILPVSLEMVFRISCQRYVGHC